MPNRWHSASPTMTPPHRHTGHAPASVRLDQGERLKPNWEWSRTHSECESGSDQPAVSAQLTGGRYVYATTSEKKKHLKFQLQWPISRPIHAVDFSVDTNMDHTMATESNFNIARPYLWGLALQNLQSQFKFITQLLNSTVVAAFT